MAQISRLGQLLTKKQTNKKTIKDKGEGASEAGKEAALILGGQALLFAIPSGSWKVWLRQTAGFGSCLSLFSKVVTLFESNWGWKKTRGRRKGWVVT